MGQAAPTLILENAWGPSKHRDSRISELPSGSNTIQFKSKDAAKTFSPPPHSDNFLWDTEQVKVCFQALPSVK